MDDSLSFESFLEGAKKAAYKAMQDHGHGEYDEFALHAGVAVERLGKAVLVSKNPVYLLDMNKGNPDLLLYFGGHLEMAADKVRTVGAKDAIARLRKLGVLRPSTQLDKLIELRNGTAHASSGDEAKTLLPTLADNVADLLSAIGLDLFSFWGRWTSAINLAADRRRSQVEREVQVRIRQARHRLEDRLKGLPLPKALRRPERSGFNFFFGTPDPDADGEVVSVTGNAGCPACDRQAVVEAAPDATSPGTPLIAVALSCPWCQLQLNSADEVRASGIDVTDALEVASHVIYGTPLPDEQEDDGTQAS
ncbi:hypothetical protein AB0C59_15450 [Streptomyces sp. NPDC048664]|uniref:hypothetical protein n=1 Tax=Streptomyces sp. NPDC048664 TaxID=3154505 RepID=UPI00342BF6C3